MNIVVLQTDNRNADIIEYIKLINKRHALFINFKYHFEYMDKKYYEHISPCTAKLFVVHNYIHNNPVDILIFLDTDAWIQNPYKLFVLVHKLIKSDKNGCISRDPYKPRDTYVNSGSFILKINDFTKNMYKYLITDLHNNQAFINKWPFDQYYFSNFVYAHKEKFMIFKPEVLNTPDGIILRQNWYKNEQMLNDIVDILTETETLLDDKVWPNPDPEGELKRLEPIAEKDNENEEAINDH
jgi:hypothetical protein